MTIYALRLVAIIFAKKGLIAEAKKAAYTISVDKIKNEALEYIERFS